MNSHFLKQRRWASALMIISSLTLFAFFSCDKEELNDDKVEINDNYYVRYVIYSSYPKIFSNWSVTTPDGYYTKTGYQTRNWEQTYGPVKKGFKCDVSVGSGSPTIEIHVSKNQEPFALQVINEGNKASYVIDF